MLLITAVVMLQGSVVEGGASLVIITADQFVITLLCGVAADPNIRTTTSLLQLSLYILHRDTASIGAGILGIVSYVSAVLEGVVTLST